MQTSHVVLRRVLSVCLLFVPSGILAGEAPARVEEALARWRAAVGGEARVAEVRALSVSGARRWVTAERDVNGERALELLLPDRFRRTDSSVLIKGAPPGVTRFVLDGQDAWVGGSDGSTHAIPRDFVHHELLRYACVLLGAPPSLGCNLAYAGEAEAPDGKAHAFDLTAPGGFAARLYLSQRDYTPLMLSYQGFPQVLTSRRVTMPSGAGADVEKALKGIPPPPPPPPAQAKKVEIQLHFEDYRPVEQLRLPHRITTSVEGVPTEEWTPSFKVNPPLKQEQFSRK